MSNLFADLAIPVSVDTLFTYRVPEELRGTISRGVRVVAPFGRRTAIGVVVKISSTVSGDRPLKSITDVIDTQPVISEELLKLTEWIAGYYFVPWGEAIKAALVQGATSPAKRIVRLVGTQNESKEFTTKEARLLKELALRGGLTIQQLQKRTLVKSIHACLSGLIRKQVIIIEEERSRLLKPKVERVIEADVSDRDRWKSWLADHGGSDKHARQAALLRDLSLTEGERIAIAQFLKSTRHSLSSLRTLGRNGLLQLSTREIMRTPASDGTYTEPPQSAITLNRFQHDALTAINEGIVQGTFRAFLLHGVTGSGKTQVYIEAIRATLDQGKTAIVLVPEISLTPQTVHRFRAHFHEKVVSLHSRMSMGERYDAWRMIHEQKFSVVIGPRSAVFAPLEHLGLIVVDEEHEGSFKQFDQTPRYHARDVAIMRASISGAAVILGSATPSIESYDNARKGKYTLLELPERVDIAQLPVIDIVNMTKERQLKFSAFREARKGEFKADYAKARASTAKLEFGLISDLLKERIEDRLRKREGIILLQNRRGFAPIVECPDCGFVLMCENCSISLTYHLTKRHCRCHYCGLVAVPPEECPQCQSQEIKFRGFGTQRIEEEVHGLFPHASLLRMDLDTTTTRGSHHRILQKFSEGGADILLGTQMVAKGLDFSRVTLVGVISADTQMLLPDFRSAERTFQLLTQVAGRAGRSVLAGEVVIQTFQPHHYALKHVVNHDFPAFFAEELSYRRELMYPPFSRLAVLECRGENEPEVMKHARLLGAILGENRSGIFIMGPAPAALARIKSRYRWHIVIKDPKESDPSGKRLRNVLTTAMRRYYTTPEGKSRRVEVSVDVDPGGMM